MHLVFGRSELIEPHRVVARVGYDRNNPRSWTPSGGSGTHEESEARGINRDPAFSGCLRAL